MPVKAISQPQNSEFDFVGSPILDNAVEHIEESFVESQPVEEKIKVIKHIEKPIEVSKNSLSTSQVCIDFWQLLDHAMDTSATVILKKHDVEVTKANLEILKNEYYPHLSINYSHEYYHGFSRPTSATIGGSTYPSNSDYQNSLYMDLNYELYHFGATDLKGEIAELDIDIVMSELELEKERIGKSLLDYYIEALKLQEQITFQQHTLVIHEALLSQHQRLYDVGRVAQRELTTQQISILTLQKEVAEKRLALSKVYTKIELLTSIVLRIDDVIFKIPEPKRIKTRAFEESMLAKNLKLKLEKKLQEIALLKKEYLPTLYANGEYRLYGSDNNDIQDAIQELERNNWRLGITLKWNIFDGFKTNKTIEKAKMESEKLITEYKLEKTKFEAEVVERKIMQDAIERILREQGRMIATLSEEKEMLTRLEEAGRISHLEIDKREVERLSSELAFRLQVIDKTHQHILQELIL